MSSQKEKPTNDDDEFTADRRAMVTEQIIKRGVRDQRVLEAMRRVKRHVFIPARYGREAYGDTPLPIGHEQTISQPYMVARMTELLSLRGDEKVLEIGTGCGYQTAVLALLAREVHSIEIVPALHKSALETLKPYENVHLIRGDGHRGLPEAAPFDCIIVTAAPHRIPGALPQQLAVPGIMVIPVGDDVQQLLTIKRTSAGFSKKSVLPVRFVPMTGRDAP